MVNKDTACPPHPTPSHFFIDFILRVFYLDTLERVSIGGPEHAVLSAW